MSSKEVGTYELPYIRPREIKIKDLETKEIRYLDIYKIKLVPPYIHPREFIFRDIIKNIDISVTFGFFGRFIPNESIKYNIENKEKDEYSPPQIRPTGMGVIDITTEEFRYLIFCTSRLLKTDRKFHEFVYRDVINNIDISVIFNFFDHDAAKDFIMEHVRMNHLQAFIVSASNELLGG